MKDKAVTFVCGFAVGTAIKSYFSGDGHWLNLFVAGTCLIVGLITILWSDN